MKDEGGRMKDRQSMKSSSVVSRLRNFILHPSSLILIISALAFLFNFTISSSAQRQRAPRIGAHSTNPRESFTPSDRLMVERAIGATCAERIRDPIGSMPIDE